MNSVWIGCEGENPADRENIGPIKYLPMPGIASYYFPYSKQPGYRAPFIMIQLTRPVRKYTIDHFRSFFILIWYLRAT